MRVIALVSPVGGVGRTAATVLLATALVLGLHGRRVLVLDADPGRARGAAGGAADGLVGWARRVRPHLGLAGELLAAQAAPDVASLLGALDRAAAGGSHADAVRPDIVLVDTAGGLVGGGGGYTGADLAHLVLRAASLALLPVHGGLDAERTPRVLKQRPLLPPGLPARGLLCGFGGSDDEPGAAACRRQGRAALAAAGLPALAETVPYDVDLLHDLWAGRLPEGVRTLAAWGEVAALAEAVARLADGQHEGGDGGREDDRGDDGRNGGVWRLCPPPRSARVA